MEVEFIAANPQERAVTLLDELFLTEQDLEQILATIGGCELSDRWVTGDQRPGRSDRWLNAIVRAI